MQLTSLYSDETLAHSAKPDPLDDLVRASPPRERLAGRATAWAIVAFLVAALCAPLEYSTAIPVVVEEQGQAPAGAGQVLLRVDAAVLDDASRNALAVLAPGTAVTLVGDAGAAYGRLLSVPGVSANGVAVAVRLSHAAGSGVAPTGRAALRIPTGSRNVAAALAELALPKAFE
ncbi:MAG: hypothetical protein OXC99_05285 [Chloroflexi bacterium]|nr:hypothetical protein [Chloroflexota bacterium]